MSKVCVGLVCAREVRASAGNARDAFAGNARAGANASAPSARAAARGGCIHQRGWWKDGVGYF